MGIMDVFQDIPILGDLTKGFIGDFFGRREQAREYQYNKAATAFSNRDSYSAYNQWAPTTKRTDEAMGAGEWMTPGEKIKASHNPATGKYDGRLRPALNTEYQQKGHARFVGDRQDDWRLERQSKQYDAEFGESKRRAQYATDLGLDAEKRSMDQRIGKLQELGLTPQEILGAGNPGYGGSSGGQASFTNVTPPEVAERQRNAAATASAQQKSTALQAIGTMGGLQIAKREQDRKDLLIGPQLDKAKAEATLKQVEALYADKNWKAKTNILANQAETTTKRFIVDQTIRKMAVGNNISVLLNEWYKSKGMDYMNPEVAKNLTADQWAEMLGALMRIDLTRTSLVGREAIVGWNVVKEFLKGTTDPGTYKKFLGWITGQSRKWRITMDVTPPRKSHVPGRSYNEQGKEVTRNKNQKQGWYE